MVCIHLEIPRPGIGKQAHFLKPIYVILVARGYAQFVFIFIAFIILTIFLILYHLCIGDSVQVIHGYT